MVRQLFFDLDRTLWDFETNSKNALYSIYNDFLLETGIEHFLHFHHTYIQINADLWHKYGDGKVTKEELRDHRFHHTLLKHGIDDYELSKTLSNEYIERSPRQTALFPGAKETLAQLQKDGYRLHIITNGFKEVQHIKLERSGISSFFEEILCSEEVGVNKPNRSIFEAALKRTDCSSQEAVMIGDDWKADIIGALNAGWTAIHFDPEHKYKKEREIPRIRSLGELPEVIGMLPIVGR